MTDLQVTAPSVRSLKSSSFPVTPLEPAISRQRLLQIARDELNKSFHRLEERDRADEEDEEEYDEDDEDTDDETDASSSYDEAAVRIQLEGLNISSLPAELVELYKDQVRNLSIKHNWLESLPVQFKYMSELVYLDVSNNKLKEFPAVLCECPSLKILDISTNMISSMPRDIKYMFQLQCLSLSNNQFEVLPPCIGGMVDLQVLEIENNPMVLPPRTMLEMKPAALHEQSKWIKEIRHYLQDNEDHLYALIKHNESNTDTWRSSQVKSNLDSSESFQLQPPPPPIKNRQRGMTATAVSRSASDSQGADNVEHFDSSTFAAANANVERLRSNSDSNTASRAAKRMGFVVKKPKTAKDGIRSAEEALDTADAIQQSHARSRSHDSLVESTPASQSHQSEGSGLLAPNSQIVPEPSPVMDSVSGAYFRRLSTLREVSRVANSRQSSEEFELQDKIIESSQKVLFALNELHTVFRRCASFCEDKQLNAKLSSLLNASRSSFPGIVSTLELLEVDAAENEYTNSLLNASIRSLALFRNLTNFVRANTQVFSSYVDIKYLRSLVMAMYQAFSELHNAWHLLYPSRNSSRRPLNHYEVYRKKDAISSPIIDDVLRNGEGLSAADDQLYEKIFHAAATAQTVLGKLTDAISKSAAVATSLAQDKEGGVSAVVASKVRDLMQTSLTGVNVTRRLMSRLESMKESGGSTVDRKKFWDELNAFLKAVIGILASSKSAMPDLPMLDDVTPNLVKLAKLAKEVPIMLEYSSYKAMLQSDQFAALQHASSTSTAQMNNTPVPLPPATPLVAVLGPAAAQAVISPSTTFPPSYSPFIPESSSSSVSPH